MSLERSGEESLRIENEGVPYRTLFWYWGEPPIAVLPQKYLAGPPGLEPRIAVLETAVIPFHHGPTIKGPA